MRKTLPLCFMSALFLFSTGEAPASAENSYYDKGLKKMTGQTADSDIKSIIRKESLKGKKPNRLVFEKSPYLLQHAFNPVEWFPWGEDAFSAAKEQNKTIFLSIGYSTCYWCHVMEREIFENEEIAAILNKYFISIKVDREERPDLDRVYMNALVSLTGSGGWPMSLFLTPDLKPFYGATYLPPVPQYGRPSFPEVIKRIHEVWADSPDKIVKSGDAILRRLKSALEEDNRSQDIRADIFGLAFKVYASLYEPVYGGFEEKVKFPRPSNFNFLLQLYKNTGNKKALAMVLETLKNMGKGGMFDHIGGGFHRYSTDQLWRIPHFEKMLYDQAQLAISYMDAYLITGDDFFKEIAVKTLDYVIREMKSKDGGFYSAQDAESAEDPEKPDLKEEGRFYLWRLQEVKGNLGARDGEIFSRYFGIVKGGNATEDPQGIFKGLNVLYRARNAAETASLSGVSKSDVVEVIKKGLATLFKVREGRPRPSLDDKILLNWNGLMISAMSKGYQTFRDKRYLEAAEDAARFLTSRLYDSEKKILRRRYRNGEARFNAHLQDYTFFVQGLIDLYEASFDIKWMKLAISLTKTQNTLFYDSEKGGFFETSGGDPSVIYRMKDSYDGAEPTGNSIAMLNLLRLYQVTADKSFTGIIDSSFRFFGAKVMDSPHSMPQLLYAYSLSLKKPEQIIIAGKRGDVETEGMLEELFKHFIPGRIVFLADGGAGQKFLAEKNSFFRNIVMKEGKPTAYVCKDFTCDYPVTRREKLAELLER